MFNSRVSPFISSLLFICFSILFTSNQVFSQTLPLPYLINNLSEYDDEDIYVGLVGKINNQDVWIDMESGDINEMKLSDNTLQGPIHNGNKGPGGDGMYADVFTTLNDIPNKTINIPQIYAVRIFIAFESPLYLYFFGADDEDNPGGYSAPSLSNDSDPNLGLKYELIELTYGDNGLWTNTTRVDAYQYPMGLEVWGTDGFYKRVGEVLTHEDILSQWRLRVSDAFQGSLDEDMEIILNPSKSKNFQEGEAYNDYFADYVDAVWARYENEDMYLSIGEAGIWRGRVTDDQFIFTNQTDEDETVGMISAKPNTLEILEASGVLAEDVTSTPSIHADQNIQKHFSAAFNRGAIDLNAPTDELLEWSDLNNYFGTNTHNEYVAFWHSETISFEGETYAFAYDDVFDYSSTIQSTVPEKVTITIGGFVNDVYVAAESVAVTSIVGGSGDNSFILNEYAATTIDNIEGGAGSNQLTLGAQNTEVGTSGVKVSLTSENTALLTANLLPLNVENSAIKWQSSDNAVATVSGGLITAVDTGTAVITVSSYDNSVSATILVEVNNGGYSNESTVRIEAENYTDMSGIQTQSTSDNNGTENVGWIDVGDYLEYQVNIATAGEYTLAYRIASVESDAVVASPAVDLQVDGESLLITEFNITGGWSQWQTQTATVTLPEGELTLRFVATGANWNLNWFDLTPVLEKEAADSDTGSENICQSESYATVSITTTSFDLIDCLVTPNDSLDSNDATNTDTPIIEISDTTVDNTVDHTLDSANDEDNIISDKPATNLPIIENIADNTDVNDVQETVTRTSKKGGALRLSLLGLLVLLLWRQRIPKTAP